MVEALTMGLGGFGRAEPAEGWGASVFVQLLDPDAFAGGGRVPPPDRLARRRLPRLGAEARRRAGAPARRGRPRAPRPGLAEGVELYPGIMAQLEGWAERLGVQK